MSSEVFVYTVGDSSYLFSSSISDESGMGDVEVEVNDSGQRLRSFVWPLSQAAGVDVELFGFIVS